MPENRPFVIVKVFCIPADLEESRPHALMNLLDDIASDLVNFLPAYIDQVIPDDKNIEVGISLFRDITDYRTQDLIWAEVEYRGHSAVRGIPYADLDAIAFRLVRNLKGFAMDHVNDPVRLQHEGLVRCKKVAVTVKAENCHYSATKQDQP